MSARQRPVCCAGRRASRRPRALSEAASGLLPPSPPPAALSRREAALLPALASLVPLPAAARPVADDGSAERVFDAGRRGVVAVASYALSPSGAVSAVEPLCSAVVWDQSGYLVAPAHCLARLAAAAPAAAAPAPPPSPTGAPVVPAPPLVAGREVDAPPSPPPAAPGTPAAAAGAQLLPPPLLLLPPPQPQLRLRVALLDASGEGTDQYEAALVGCSPRCGLAVLKLSGAPPELLAPAPLAAGGELRVGQAAFVLSRGFGAPHALAAGALAGLRRPLALPGAPSGSGGGGVGLLPGGALQMDAEVAEGAAVLDSAGRLMGLGLGRGTGRLGWAAPADLVRAAVPQLIAFGSVAPDAI